MNVGELKKFIQDIPDETPIVTPAFDHQYTLVYVYYEDIVSADKVPYRGTYMYEYYGPDYVDSADKVIKALVVS